MRYLLIYIVTMIIPAYATAEVNLDLAIRHYNQDGGLTASAERGEKKWFEANTGDDGKERNCTVCHGRDLTKQGKHVKTGKIIEPLAASANKERFTDLEKVEKWFKRNCKWTFDRECTNQEKIDFLEYLSQF